MVHRTVRESSFSGAGKLRGAARLVADVIRITRPAERGDRRSGRLGLLDLPFISDFRARRRNGPGYGKPRQPLFPDLLLLGSKTVEAGDFSASPSAEMVNSTGFPSGERGEASNLDFSPAGFAGTPKLSLRNWPRARIANLSPAGCKCKTSMRSKPWVSVCAAVGARARATLLSVLTFFELWQRMR